jgi:hypothetical protein
VDTQGQALKVWLVDMDSALEALFAEVPKDLAARLDYSIDSLLALEPWLLKLFPTDRDAINPQAAPAIDRLARYVGETIRKSVGGHWEIRTDNPKYVYHGIPQLVGDGLVAECPRSLVTAATNRRTGRYIFLVVSAMAEESTSGLQEQKAKKGGGSNVDRLPVLKIRRTQGDDALLSHKLTADEKRLFKVFDTATAKLPKGTDLSEYHTKVAELGEQFGLTPGQSIAFWTRTTFRIFEA